MLQNDHTPAIGFEKILLATDFSNASKAAFETAVDLCRKFSSKLFIVHAFEYTSPQVPEVPSEVSGLYEEVKLSLDRLLRSARDRGVECDSSIVGGLAAPSILETVDTLGINLIVLGTHANRGLERLIFGSTAETILRKAPCPVVTVGPHFQYRGKDSADGPVLFATDFNSTTVHSIRFAASVCEATHAPLHCLTVLPMKMEGNALDARIPEVMNQSLLYLAMECGEKIAVPICASLFGPDVPESVVNYAKEQNASMIVLGVHTAHAMSSHGPCSATLRLIAQSPCPVMTVNTWVQKDAAILTDDNDGTETAKLRASWLRRRSTAA
jgi:nucleotide-binding universal stress UspA family protein